MTQSSTGFPLRCRCGYVYGAAQQVTPRAGFRFVCYCRDCQAFARFLGRPDVLDAAGGTDIFQMPTGRVKLIGGIDAVRCVHISRTVFRWYCSCCRTPIGNTAGPGFPVIGLIHSFMDHDGDGRPRDVVLGAPLCRLHEHSATGRLASNAPPPPSLRVSALRTTRILAWWLRGLGHPNPFFNEQTKAPISSPEEINDGGAHAPPLP